MELGQRGRDKITGFDGVATGRCEYLSGCAQVLLAPRVKADGTFQESQWFDEQRVDIVTVDPVVLDNGATPGFDRPAPVRRAGRWCRCGRLVA